MGMIYVVGVAVAAEAGGGRMGEERDLVTYVAGRSRREEVDVRTDA